MRIIVAIAVAMLTTVAASRADAQYKMAVNHGTGWTEAPGEYRTLAECNAEAVAYAKKYSAQAGCASALALQRYWAETAFQRSATYCASEAGVELIQKPGMRVKILGTARARFAFDECMGKSGHVMEDR